MCGNLHLMVMSSTLQFALVMQGMMALYTLICHVILYYASRMRFETAVCECRTQGCLVTERRALSEAAASDCGLSVEQAFALTHGCLHSLPGRDPTLPPCFK